MEAVQAFFPVKVSVDHKEYKHGDLTLLALISGELTHVGHTGTRLKSVSNSKVYALSTHTRLLSLFTHQNASQQSSLLGYLATAEAPCVWLQLYTLGCGAADLKTQTLQEELLRLEFWNPGEGG